MTKVLACAFLVLALASARMDAAAQSYPSKPVRLIVPLGAGGATDINARVVAEKLGERLGQAIVVENRPGAEGVIGMDAAAKSAPDGYTLVLGSSTTLAANFSLRSKLPFHPVNDFAPVAMAFKNAFNVLVIHPGLPAQNLKEFIALAKSKPGQFFYGTATSGAKICTEMFKTMAGVDLAMVNYKSSPTALNDLMGGQLHFICEPVATVMPHVRAGKVRALGITSPTRVIGAPDVPSVAEAGLPGFEYSAWVGVFAPAGTPRDIITRLSADIAVVLNQPETAKRIQNAGFDPMVGGPEELAALLKKEMDRAVKVVRDAGIQPE
jgi:tripartite-type tricarboxylate transporter receptor subunit TctC